MFIQLVIVLFPWFIQKVSISPMVYQIPEITLQEDEIPCSYFVRSCLFFMLNKICIGDVFIGTSLVSGCKRNLAFQWMAFQLGSIFFFY